MAESLRIKACQWTNGSIGLNFNSLSVITDELLRGKNYCIFCFRSTNRVCSICRAVEDCSINVKPRVI